MNSIEICAGAGGQALGLEWAGFAHEALVELDANCCETLRLNRSHWNVLNEDVEEFQGLAFHGVELLAGGVPCPPFSVAGKQLGSKDERDLFPHALRLVDEIRPQAVMLENVKGFLEPRFKGYREKLLGTLRKLGYQAEIKLINASDHGVPQLRPRVVLVALLPRYVDHFEWPEIIQDGSPTVGEALQDLIEENGWRGADKWIRKANTVAPTIVGGSKKHGGPDLGPTRSKRAWAQLGVDAGIVALEPPAERHEGMPRLTVRMVARLQGFPDDWQFTGSKTTAYRQVGNAFPPPVAKAVGCSIVSALDRSAKRHTVLFSATETR